MASVPNSWDIFGKYDKAPTCDHHGGHPCSSHESCSVCEFGWYCPEHINQCQRCLDKFCTDHNELENGLCLECAADVEEQSRMARVQPRSAA